MRQESYLQPLHEPVTLHMVLYRDIGTVYHCIVFCKAVSGYRGAASALIFSMSSELSSSHTAAVAAGGVKSMFHFLFGFISLCSLPLSLFVVHLNPSHK